MDEERIKFNATITHGGKIALWRGSIRVGLFECMDEALNYLIDTYGEEAFVLNSECLR